MTAQRKLIYIVLALVMLNLNAWLCIRVGKQQQLTQMRQAYAICYQSHFITSGEAEDTCGRALDATQTRFLCDNYGDVCHLEVMQ